jgi:conjugal transfer pilus assembly protein TraV
MGMIDSSAVSALGADATAIGTMPNAGAPSGGFTLAGYPGAEPGRSSDRVLKVVFPAHADASGIYREEAVAHVVVERGSWVQSVALRKPVAPVSTMVGSLDDAIAAHAASASPSASDRVAESERPFGLAEVAAGLTAPPVLSLDPTAGEIKAGATPGTEIAVGTEGAPTATAIALARAGHRIALRRGRAAPHDRAVIRQEAEIERTRALNLRSLQIRASMPTGAATMAIPPRAPPSAAAQAEPMQAAPNPVGSTTAVGTTKSRDPAEAARRVHEMARPLLSAPKPRAVRIHGPALSSLANADAPAKPESGQ